MALYEDALVRKINSEGKSDVEAAAATDDTAVNIPTADTIASPTSVKVQSKKRRALKRRNDDSFTSFTSSTGRSSSLPKKSGSTTGPHYSPPVNTAFALSHSSQYTPALYDDFSSDRDSKRTVDSASSEATRRQASSSSLRRSLARSGASRVVTSGAAAVDSDDSVVSTAELPTPTASTRKLSWRRTPFPRVKRPVATTPRRKKSPFSAGVSRLRRALFKGRLEVTPRSVISPRHTRSGKQIGSGRIRIQTW